MRVTTIGRIDDFGYKIISRYLIHDFTIPIAKLITNFAGMYWLVSLTVLLIMVLKDKKTKILISLNLALSATVNYIIKQIIQRPRPTGHRIIEESGYSFPSGHSMVSMAFYGFLIYLIYLKVSNKYLKAALITALVILIFSIGISRIFLGVHYTTDVIAGYGVAIVYLIIYTRIAKKYIS